MRPIAILIACMAIPMFAQKTAQKTVIQPVSAEAVTMTRTFALGSGGRLNLSGSPGSVKITAWDKNEAELTATFTPSAPKQAHSRIVAVNKNNMLSLEATLAADREHGGPCDIELKVPRNIICDIDAKYGSIELDSIEGEIEIKTVYGGIRLSNVSGNIDASTKYGTINATHLKTDSRLKLSTKYGNVVAALADPNGTIKAATLYGTIQLTAPGIVERKEVWKNLRARSWRSNTWAPPSRTKGEKSLVGVEAAVGNGAAKIDVETKYGNIVVL